MSFFVMKNWFQQAGTNLIRSADDIRILNMLDEPLVVKCKINREIWLYPCGGLSPMEVYLPDGYDPTNIKQFVELNSLAIAPDEYLLPNIHVEKIVIGKGDLMPMNTVIVAYNDPQVISLFMPHVMIFLGNEPISIPKFVGQYAEVYLAGNYPLSLTKVIRRISAGLLDLMVVIGEHNAVYEIANFEQTLCLLQLRMIDIGDLAFMPNNMLEI